MEYIIFILAWCAGWYAVGLFLGFVIEFLTGGADE